MATLPIPQIPQIAPNVDGIKYPPAPFNPPPKPPFSADQRQKMIAWITAAINASPHTGTLDTNALNNSTDAQLASYYSTELSFTGFGASIGPSFAPPGVEQGIAGTINNATSTINSLSDLYNAIGNPNTWKRVAMFAVGGIGVYVGARMLFDPNAKPTKPLKSAANLATNLIPETRALKVVKKGSTAMRTKERYTG